VDFQLSAVLGVVFGVLAAACAFVISYAEYKRNWSFRGSAWKMALRSALVTFAFFFLAALLLAEIFRLVM
jgi:RsiW-degrading membrane proteinase PrsW (M82 family)